MASHVQTYPVLLHNVHLRGSHASNQSLLSQILNFLVTNFRGSELCAPSTSGCPRLLPEGSPGHAGRLGKTTPHAPVRGAVGSCSALPAPLTYGGGFSCRAGLLCVNYSRVVKIFRAQTHWHGSTCPAVWSCSLRGRVDTQGLLQGPAPKLPLGWSWASRSCERSVARYLPYRIMRGSHRPWLERPGNP